MKRVFCFLLALSLVFALSAAASAVDYGCDVSTDSQAVYLENLDTGAVIMDKNADQKMFPASTTKIMTYVVVADHVSDFDNTMVSVKSSILDGLDPESTVMGLSNHIGEEYSIRDLLYGMMLPSGNDAALVLADYIGSGIPGFVEMMNSKAAELGCTGTHFVNPHGLHNADHYTTARDLATITKYACSQQSFMEITNTVSYTPARFSQPITNTNYMINSGSQYVQYYYPNVKGVKTGYTDEAGKCLVTTADKDDFTYLCVALGAPYTVEEDVNYAMIDTAALYDWVFENMGVQTIYDSSEVVKTVSVNNGKGSDNLNLIPASTLTALLPKSYDKSLVHVETECADTIDAPVAKDQVVGKVTVYYDDMTVGTTDLVASREVEQDRTKVLGDNIGKWFKKNLIWIIIVVAVFVALIITLKVVSNAQKKKRARERARRRYRD